MQAVIAREAARLAPPDLARQIEKHPRDFERGVAAPFSDTDAGRHMKNPDGYGSLDRVIAAEVEGGGRGDPRAPAVRGDRGAPGRRSPTSWRTPTTRSPPPGRTPRRGATSPTSCATPRAPSRGFPLVFYGLPARGSSETARRWCAARSADAPAPRRASSTRWSAASTGGIDFASGLGRFDDRSTRLRGRLARLQPRGQRRGARAALIWLAAGGADERAHLPAGGKRLLVLPRAAR